MPLRRLLFGVFVAPYFVLVLRKYKSNLFGRGVKPQGSAHVTLT